MGDNSPRRDGRSPAKQPLSKNSQSDGLVQFPAPATELALLVIGHDRTVRFATPAVTAVLGGHAAYIGQPLAELAAGDPTLPEVVNEALASHYPFTTEIKFGADVWYSRQVIPFSNPSSTGISPTGGSPARAIVVYSGLSLHRRALQEMRNDFLQWNLVEQEYLATARREAVEEFQVRATAAARTIAGLSSEELQAIHLVAGLFRQASQGNGLQRSREALALATDGIEGKLHSLGTILDRDQNAAPPEHQPVPIQRIFDSVAASLPTSVRVEGLLRIVPSRALVRTDPRLLARALHALVAHRIESGDTKLVLGCRHGKHERVLELRTQSNRFPRPSEDAGPRDFRSIWRSIAEGALNQLGHRQDVPSLGDRVSRYTIAIPIAKTTLTPDRAATPTPHFVGARGVALVVSGDGTLRNLLADFLRQRGFMPTVAVDGKDALDQLIELRCRPSLLVGDFDLPGHLNGGDVVALIRESLQIELPAILLRSGYDTAPGLPTSTLRRCAILWKPVHPDVFDQRIDELVKGSPWPDTMVQPRLPEPTLDRSQSLVAILDADTPGRAPLAAYLRQRGYRTASYATDAAFMEAHERDGVGCVILDAGLLGIESEAFILHLREKASAPQVVVLSNQHSIAQAVALVRAGAADFLPKPANPEQLESCIDRALTVAAQTRSDRATQISAQQRLSMLTARERDIMQRILQGGRNKTIAHDLALSQRTVEYHRAAIMRKMGVAHVTDLVRICAEAIGQGLPAPAGEPVDDLD